MAAACDAAGMLLVEVFMWRHHAWHAHVQAVLDSGFGLNVDRWPEGRIVVERAYRPDDTPRRIDIYRGSEHVLAKVRRQFANEADRTSLAPARRR